MKDVCSGSYVQRRGTLPTLWLVESFLLGGRLVPRLNLDGCKGGIKSGEAQSIQSSTVVLRVWRSGRTGEGACKVGDGTRQQ